LRNLVTASPSLKEITLPEADDRNREDDATTCCDGAMPQRRRALEAPIFKIVDDAWVTENILNGGVWQGCVYERY